MTDAKSQKLHRNHWIRAAALSAAMVLTSASVHAQFLKRDGNALDANNRVGSGGINDGGSDRGSAVTGNQIITGNVTGGREFRGPVGYRDTREFRDIVGSRNSDRFIRDSSGVPHRGQTTLIRPPTAFYGGDLAAPLPPNYIRAQGTDTYVNVGGQPQGPQPFTGGLNQQRFSSQTLGGYGDALPGSLPSDANFLSGSPLYGVRVDSRTQVPGDLTNDPLFATSGDRLRTSDQMIRQMREELNATATDAQAPGAAATETPAAALNSSLNNTVGQPTDGTAGAIANPNINTLLGAAAAEPSAVGSRRQLLVAPAQQSAQYKELVRRMEQRGEATTPQQANRDFNDLRRAQEQGAKAATAKPGDPKNAGQGGNVRPIAPGGQPGRAPAPLQPREPAVPQPAVPQPEVKPAPEKPASPAAEMPARPDPAGQDAAVVGPSIPTAPLEIKSLATGVTAKGLADLLKSAEDLMRDEKYGTAVARYDQAARVVPNNPMITLGRAHANLGGASYGQAELDLRRAVQAEPALLLGRYDLNSMLGAERVKFLVKDLKAIAAGSPKEARPLILLTYLAYNTGNGPDVDKYLAAAQAIAVPNDSLLQRMSQTYSVLGLDPKNANK